MEEKRYGPVRDQGTHHLCNEIGNARDERGSFGKRVGGKFGYGLSVVHRDFGCASTWLDTERRNINKDRGRELHVRGEYVVR